MDAARSVGTEIVLTHERPPDHDAGVSHIQGWTLMNVSLN
jgi:hypothetical protein